MKRLKKHCLLLMMLVLMTACNVVRPQEGGEPAPESVEDISVPQVDETTVAAQNDEGGSRTSGDDENVSKTVKLGYHYRPPDDGTKVSKLADQASFIILSKNDEKYRDQIREAGYDGLILQYVMANEVDGPADSEPGGSCNEMFKPWQNQAANRVGDFCSFIHPNEDWFLHNEKGERLYGMNEDRYFYRMNPASEGWRQFALERFQEFLRGNNKVAPLGYDGLFFDNVELSMEKTLRQLENSDGEVKEYRSEREFRKAWQAWLRYMRNRLGSNTPLWANLIAPHRTADEWNDYLPYLDGVMNEAFVTGYNWPLSPKQQTNELLQAEYALAQGKGVYAVSQGKQKDTSRQKFALASYLLVMQPGAPNYFRYTQKYDEWWHYDNYNLNLGIPLGPRYKIKNGWRRNFTNGYVTVDQVRRKGKIVEGGS